MPRMEQVLMPLHAAQQINGTPDAMTRALR